MLATILVILPVFLLILVGSVCRRFGFPGAEFWPPAERLSYYLLFPVLLVTTLARADFSGLAVVSMVTALVGAILVMTALALGLRRLLRADGPAFTSLYQGVIRMNTYIGLSVAYGVHGEAGLAAAAVAVAAIVPVVNVLCVLVLARFGRAVPPGWRGIGRQFLTNPLILACVVGGLLNATGWGLPPVLGPMLEILARAALPLGLLTVGAALELRATHANRVAVLTSAGLKLLVLPGLTLGGLLALGVTGVGVFVAVLFTALPTATSAYVLARQLGGDAQLMAVLITAQTFLSMLSLPLVLGAIGYLA